MTNAMPEAEIDGLSQDDLVNQCRQGRECAWRQLHDRHYSFVYRTARRLGIPEEEIDDLCQEVFLVVFRKLDAFRSGRLTTWIYRITANTVSDRHRRRRFREGLVRLFGQGQSSVSTAPEAEQELERKDAERLVGKVLAALKPREREVFTLFELEGLCGAEVAERVGCRVETVWVHLHNARKNFFRLAQKKGLRREWGDEP